jgi:hypothetical protein
MMTPLNIMTTDTCQCAKAKGACESEGEAGTTVICPDCHLEEATAREGHDAEHKAVEEAAPPEERRIYAAFRDSPYSRIISRNGLRFLFLANHRLAICPIFSPMEAHCVSRTALMKSENLRHETRCVSVG